MDCKIITDDMLLDLSEGKLDDASKSAVEAHFIKCDACKRRYMDMKSFSKAMQESLESPEIDVPRSIDEAVMAELSRIGDPEPVKKKKVSLGTLVASSVFSLVVGLGIGLLLLPQGESRNPSPQVPLSYMNSDQSQKIASLESSLKMRDDELGQMSVQLDEMKSAAASTMVEWERRGKEYDINMREQAGMIQRLGDMANSLEARLKEGESSLKSKTDAIDSLSLRLVEDGEEIARLRGEIAQLQSSRQSLSLLGDVNSDGALDHRDSEALDSFILTASHDEYLRMYDINEDGKVDVADSLFLATLIRIAKAN